MLLSTIYQIHGKEKSGKSTILFDWLNRYFMDVGGQALLIDTESKISTSLLQRIMGENSEQLDLLRIPVLENVQATMTTYFKSVRKSTFDKKIPVMLGMGIDSFRVAAQSTVDLVDSDGHASKQFAAEALLWRQYLASVLNKMTGAPIALFFINHTVEKPAANSFQGKQDDVGGGKALKYYETYQFKVSACSPTVDKSKEITNLIIKSDYNSNGIAGRKIYPRVIYKQEGQDPNKVVIDWDFADIQLLTGADFPRAQAQKEGICDVKEATTKGLFNDKILGLNNVPFSEIKAAIYSDKERLSALRQLLGIVEYRTMEELLNDNWFFDGGACSADDEED
jgi:RecA/RadA recombinase